MFAGRSKLKNSSDCRCAVEVHHYQIRGRSAQQTDWAVT